MTTVTPAVYSVANAEQAQANKTFFKESLALTGMEVSYTQMEPGQSMPFLHRHKQNEELYYCVSGQGQIQVNGEILEFPA